MKNVQLSTLLLSNHCFPYGKLTSSVKLKKTSLKCVEALANIVFSGRQRPTQGAPRCRQPRTGATPENTKTTSPEKSMPGGLKGQAGRAGWAGWRPQACVNPAAAVVPSAPYREVWGSAQQGFSYMCFKPLQFRYSTANDVLHPL